MRALILTLCFVLMPSLAHAGTVGKIRQIKNDKISFRVMGPVQKGDTIKVKGFGCTYVVKGIKRKKRGKLGFAKKDDCPDGFQARKGQALVSAGGDMDDDEEDMDDEPMRTKPMSGSDSMASSGRFKLFGMLEIAAFLQYSMTDTIVAVGGIGTTPIDIDFAMGSGIELGGELMCDLNFLLSNLKFGFGLVYGMERDISEYKRSDQSFATPADGVSFSYILPEFNLHYFMLNNKLDIVGGLNYSLPSITSPGGVSLSSGLGFKLGAAYNIWKGLFLQGEYRIVNFSGDVGLGFVAYTADQAQVAGINLSARWVF